MTSKNVFSLLPPPPDKIRISRYERSKRKIEAKEKKQQIERERQLRDEHLKRRATEKPVYVLTANHKPTYCILSHKRINGVDRRSPPKQFTRKNEIQSIKSMSRIKNAINWMLLFADKKRVYSKKLKKSFSFRLAFLTLTLSDKQKHDDDYIKQHMLQPFLYWLDRYYSAAYVWKAETQLNGNIHFHLTIDTYVPWQSVRAKWNKLLAKHHYCKVMQDGSNDKGDAATQIKSVLSETKCAKDIGGYMSKKDAVTKADIKRINEGAAGYETAMVHCKWDPDKPPEEQNRNWYKRVIDGRLWGCSQSLSGISIFLDEQEHDFKKEENIFFRQNKDIYNLGKKVIEREKQKYRNVDFAERQVRCITDEDIQHKYRFMESVFIHPHLSLMKKGGTLQKLIHEEKLKRKKNFQKFFTEN